MRLPRCASHATQSSIAAAERPGLVKSSGEVRSTGWRAREAVLSIVWVTPAANRLPSSRTLARRERQVPGGAFRPGGVAEVIDELVSRRSRHLPDALPRAAGVGRRPEAAHAARLTARAGRRSIASGARSSGCSSSTRVWCYSRLAGHVVSQVRAELPERFGFTVIGIVRSGIVAVLRHPHDARPRRSFEVMAATPIESVDRRAFNRDAVVACRRGRLRAVHQGAGTPASAAAA